MLLISLSVYSQSNKNVWIRDGYHHCVSSDSIDYDSLGVISYKEAFNILRETSPKLSRKKKLQTNLLLFSGEYEWHFRYMEISKRSRRRGDKDLIPIGWKGSVKINALNGELIEYQKFEKTLLGGVAW